MTKLTVPVTNKDHILGNPKAPVTLLEYGDFECPNCGEAFPIVKAVLSLENDKVKLAFRHFPLSQLHSHALPAAFAAEAAGLQNKFWEMHNLLFINQDKLSDKDLLKYAEKLNLNLKKFNDDVNSVLIKEQVHEDFLNGVKSGVNATPTFFINGERFDGAYELNELTSAIERATGDIERPILI